jgi:YidC/Oxa1 family membrane protein insertase
MQKRLFLAVALSFIVLFVWQSFIIKPEHKAMVSSAPSGQAAVSAVAQESIGRAVVAAPQSTAPLTEYSRESNLVKTVFVDQDAAVKDLLFKKYKEYSLPLANGFSIGNGMVFNRQSVDNKRVTYTHQDAQQRITKEFEFTDSSYAMKLLVTIENVSSQPITFSFPLVLGTLNLQRPGLRGPLYQDAAVSLPDKIVYPNLRKDSSFSSISFLSLRDTYFCAIIEPKAKEYSAQFKKISDKETEVSLQSPQLVILPGQKSVQEFLVYLGPQDLKVLGQFNTEWQSVVYFGKLDAIAHVLLKALIFLHGLIKSWGIAIILLSLIIYIILFPLTLQQLRSMREMQRVQPKVEELRCKYKEDAMRLQKETMELYKEHKINPLGGCLPMLLQIPVFISFYLVLARSIQLKGASFLWIKDMSEPDKFLVFQNINVPFLSTAGNLDVNLLPIVMTVASFFQQKVSAGQMTGQSAEQQRMMMFLFPLMFLFFFYHMPAGLVLYWLSNTTFTVFQQMAIMKKK